LNVDLVVIKMMDESISLDEWVCDHNISHPIGKGSGYPSSQYQEDESIFHSVLYRECRDSENPICRVLV